MSEKNVYYNWFETNCKYIDARTFSGIKNQILKYLKDPKCPHDTKLLFGTFLLLKIYMMYKFRGPDKTDIVNDLIPSITECKNVISKGEYLKYHDVEAMSMIALHFYLNRFKDRETFFILQLLNDTQLIKGYLQRSDINDKELLEHFLSWVERSPIDEQRSNILDVLLRYYPKDTRVIALHEEMKFGADGGGIRNDVYNDAQNVHDEEINSSVLNAAENLIDWGKEEGHELDTSGSQSLPFNASAWAKEILFGEGGFGSQEKDIIECCLQRCAIDTTTFGSGFTIADIFFTTLKYITLSPNKKDMYPIFMEEMDSMKELCSSGYVARCISVLQGQSEDGEFDIKIPFSKKLHALISMKISSSMEKANENVVFGTYDEKYKNYFLDFVSGIVNEYLASLIESNSFEEISKNICKVLEKITGDDNWVFDEHTIKVSYKLIQNTEKECSTDWTVSYNPEINFSLEKYNEEAKKLSKSAPVISSDITD